MSCPLQCWALGIEVAPLVDFCSDSGITRNVLGRRGWLDRIRFGFVDHGCAACLDAYDR